MYAKKKSMSMKVVVLLLAVVLLIGCVAGGTVAYLVATTDRVVNTFSVGNITITLDENKTKDIVYKVVPGAMQAKEPVVTVKGGSEKCYVYVYVDMGLQYRNEYNQLADAANLDINPEIWIKVGETGNKALYRYHEVVDAADDDIVLEPVFTRVFYHYVITKDDIVQLDAKTIEVEAYAHQVEHVRNDFSIDKKVCDYYEVDVYVAPDEP